MSRSDSTFLFEIGVEELRSFVSSKQFVIKSQFADIFSLILKEPFEVQIPVPKYKKVSKSKTKVKKPKASITVQEDTPKVRAGQSILFTSNIDRLVSHMLQYPMEISLWNIRDPQDRIGSAVIPWNPAFVEFLARLYKLEDPSPVIVNDVHNVFNEITSKRMASIRVSIKLTHMKNKISSKFNILSEDYPNTYIYKELESKPVTKLSTTKTGTQILSEETGTIKTIYSNGKKSKKSSKRSNKKNNKMSDKVVVEDLKEIDEKKPSDIEPLDKFNDCKLIDRRLFSFIKSEMDIEKSRQFSFLRVKSCSSLKPLNTLNYIFGDRSGPFGSRIYTVGYFTVDKTDSKATPLTSKSSEPSHESKDSKPKYEFKLCASDCPVKSDGGSAYSLDLPAEAVQQISVTKCKELKCLHKKDREPTDPPDDRILLDVTNFKIPCCTTEIVEEQLLGNVKAKFQMGSDPKDPCFCACECTFGFGKKTTYCSVCGGYELAGDDVAGKPQYLMPIPCPVYHKAEKKAKTGSTSGSESKKKYSRSLEPESKKKGKTKRKDDRFKFNYGYKGIPPQIGHSQCGMPCTGTINNVPKSMGWLWTADDIPGMKFRPLWKPGAVNKFVLRLLKIARNPGEVSKKRRKPEDKKKRPPKRPLLVVHKKDGEYNVTMETMKAYSKPRALNQQPYEDKDPIVYTIGRTEEENRERQKKKERKQRRLEREQREFIQSAFKDMCHDICLKTYQQALGILPDAEDPQCTCYPAHPGPVHTNVDVSCSCSEDEASLASDTDSDEWIVEFTPPVAHFDPTYTAKKIAKVDTESQYNYLDYRVKLLDRFGNPVPRFFKGFDGKEQCSDLGGFWSPDHQWLEINVDGYIAPDGRWAPLAFTGPSGEQIETDLTGKFQATNGKWLVVGVDGFIDSHGKWKSYPKPRSLPNQKRKQRVPAARKGAGDKKAPKPESYEKYEPTWSCFGDASPVTLSKMGIVGHGPDRKLLYKALSDLLAKGSKDVKLPLVPRVPKLSQRKKKRAPEVLQSHTYFTERAQCKHPVPPERGVIINERGQKRYFKSRTYKNLRPRDRLLNLESQGRSLSTFHEPCFHSFIDRESMQQHLRERLMNMGSEHNNTRSIATQS